VKPRSVTVVLGLAVLAVAAVAPIVVGDRGLPWSPVRTASVSGTVSCTSGRSVVGVYIDEITNTGFFASWNVSPGSRSVAVYQGEIPMGMTYQVHVGCGGTPGAWLLDLHSEYTTELRQTLRCQDIPRQPGYEMCL
jgi:hypothetical protein